MTLDAVLHRWPMAVHKTELVHGVLLFAGHFDERDVATAQRTYPGRRIILNADHRLEVHPAGTEPARPLID